MLSPLRALSRGPAAAEAAGYKPVQAPAAAGAAAAKSSPRAVLGSVRQRAQLCASAYGEPVFRQRTSASSV